MKPTKRIVAEVSRNWPGGVERAPSLISERFEMVIATNAKRGFQLESWQLSRVPAADEINETIVAVFVKK